MQAEDLTGQRFGKLVIERRDTSRKGGVYWVARCDCGGTSSPASQSLKSGRTRSCRCEMNSGCTGPFKHGWSYTREYACWSSMKQRCFNPSDQHWPDYGGRGITVCEEWRDSFEAFIAHIGPRPSGMSIDRINNNGNYEPGNVRWATPKQQNNNRRPRPLSPTCPSGHPRDEVNSYFDPRGYRHCRACRREGMRRATRA